MKLRQGVAGVQNRDMDPGPLGFEVEALRRLDQETLDRAVQGVAAGRGHLAGERGDVQHPAETALDHAGQQQARQFDRRRQHDLDHGAVGRQIRVQKAGDAAEAGIIDQTVDAQAARGYVGDQTFRRGGV